MFSEEFWFFRLIFLFLEKFLCSCGGICELVCYGVKLGDVDEKCLGCVVRIF